MKKLLLSGIALSLCLAVSAQNAKRSALPIVGTHVHKMVRFDKATRSEVNLIRSSNPTVTAVHRTSIAETQIGTTDYDLQSNNGGTGNRVRRWDDGTISAVWTMVPIGGASTPDRGTGYNYYDGSAWGPIPTARIESIRTGFPNIGGSSTGGEAVSSHVPNAYVSTRATKGTGAWAEQNLPFPSTVASTWPRMTVGGANGQTIHEIANTGAVGNGQADELFYWRSPDFGATWDISESKISVLDSNNIRDVTIDGYDIDSHGDVIAIVCGGFGNDLVLAKSLDNGTTWTKRIIKHMPIDGPGGAGTPFDSQVQISDVDGDGVADNVTTAGSDPSVVVDDNNVVHVWVSAMSIIVSTAGTVNFDPTSDGLFYWNDGMADDDLFNHPVDFVHDLDGDGALTLSGGDPGSYQCALTGMPAGGICSTGKLFVAYTSLVEGTNSGGTDQTFRDVFYSESSDGGVTWSTGINLTSTDFDEEAYTNMAKRINGGELDIIFQRDAEPGTAIGGDADPVATNNIFFINQSIDCSLGINENSPEVTNISVYPNPATSVVKVDYSVAKAGAITVNVVNVMGQTVAHYNVNAIAGANTLSLNVSKLASGIYSVNTIVGDKTFTNKIVKQ